MSSASFRGAGILLATLLLLPAPLAQLAVSAGVSPDDQSTIGEALDVGAFSIQSITLPDELGTNVTFDVVLDGQEYTLALHPWSIRSEEHYQVLAQGEDGGYTPVDVGPSHLWRGLAVGVPGSRVSADLRHGQVDALVRLGDATAVWAIQPLTVVDPGADAADHVIYSSRDGIDRGLGCGGALLSHGGPADAPADPGYAGSGDKVCQIACDADFEFYGKNGSSVANTEADIANIIDRVENIYQPDAGIVYLITTIIVRTAEPDPYTSTSPGTLLNQFQSHWNSNQGGIVRDVAHLFTGKNINGGVIGIAYLSVICSLNSAYGLSESKFTSNLSFRTGLTAHELGHNWSAQHCDGQGDCWIMCSGIGGCAGSVTKFGNSAKNSITNKKNAVGCLSNAVPPPPPTLSSLSPATVSPLGLQITVNGTGLAEATSATVGGQTIGVVLINDSQVKLDVPSASGLGPVSVTVSNDGGTSNALTLTYVIANPPVFQVPTLINTSFDTSATWKFATAPGDTCLLLVNLVNTQFNYKGYSVLLTSFPVIPLTPNAAGVGELVVPIDPSMGGVGIYNIYTQMVFLHPAIYHATAVKTTAAF